MTRILKSNIYHLFSIFLLMSLISCESIDLNQNEENAALIFHQIADEDFHDSVWDCGIYTEDGNYLLAKSEGNNYICLVNDTRNEHPLLLVFDNNYEVVEMLYDDIFATICQNGDRPTATIYHDGTVSNLTFDSRTNSLSSTPIYTKSSDTGIYRDLLISLGKGAITSTTEGGAVSLIISFLKGENIDRDLSVFTIGEIIGKNSGVLGVLIGAGYDVYKAWEEYLRNVESMYFGDSTISITTTNHIADERWSLISSIENLPDILETWSIIKVGIVIGTDINLLKRNADSAHMEQTVNDNASNSQYTFTIGGIEEGKTHYGRPYMIVYTTNGLIDIETDYIRYGDVVELSDLWADLGLPSGTLWAKYNVGATSPEEFGGYYAWGETDEKSSYTIDNYKYGESYVIPNNGNELLFRVNLELIDDIIYGTTNDIAHLMWGDEARMPSLTEVEELYTNCTFKSDSINGVNGCLITGPNQAHIFVPFAGYKSSYEHGFSSEFGGFWIGEILYEYDSNGNIGAWYTPMFSATIEDRCLKIGGDLLRAYVGLPVRPVKDKEQDIN